VVLPEATLQTLGYRVRQRGPVVSEQSRTVAGREITASVESHLAVYGPADGALATTATAPTVGVASTPRAVAMGRSFNPLARLSVANLLTSAAGTAVLRDIGLDEVGHARSRLRWRRGPTVVGSQAGTVVETDTTVESYSGILGGTPPSVAFVHLGRVDARSVVLVAAVHGRDTADPERPLVGPDAGYLSLPQLATARDLLVTAGAALRYRDDPG